MSDTLLTARHPLAAVDSGRLGLDQGDPAGISLLVPANGTVLQLLSAPQDDLDGTGLTKLLARKDLTLRDSGPNQWLLVGEQALPPEDITALKDKLGDRVALVDQSQGRVKILVSGPAATELLAKGMAVDFSLDAFAVGQSAQALFGHTGVHATRVEEQAFELLVFRGFAESLWEQLLELSLEFGVQADVQVG
ncbi:sarcosine oxidase subunit gamma [Rhodovibrionaceae bacterium A322]